MDSTTAAPPDELRYHTGTSASLRSGYSVSNLRRLADASKIRVLRTAGGTRVYVEADLDELRRQRQQAQETR